MKQWMIGAALLAAVPVAAQTATPPAAGGGRGSTLPVPPAAGGAAPGVSPAPPAPAGPQIDADAKAVLKEAQDVYKALKTYAATTTFTAVADGENKENATFETRFERPNKAVVRKLSKDGNAIFLTDGKSFIVSVPQAKDKFLKQPVQPNTAEEVLSQSAALGPFVATMLMGHDMLGDLPPAVKSIKLGADGDVDGVAVKNVVWEMSGGTNTGDITFAVGKADHLLRRVTLTMKGKARDGKDRNVVATESYSNVQANPALTPGEFIFVPPAGAKPVESLEPASYDERLKPGAMPFEISAKDLSGKPVSLAQFKGRVLLIDFWATWCGPCVAEMPNVKAAYAKLHGQGFEILGISLDEDKAELLSYLKQNKITWTQVFDGKGWESAIAKKYGVQAIPFTLLIGRDGKIAAVNLRGPELEPAIRKALGAGKPAAKPTAKKPTKKK